jgi:uncharacterized protein (DUF927 family)
MGKKLDFKKINALALAQAESIVSHYAPDGKLNGREWVARNPNRNDSKAGSFSINVDTGVWCDFATDDKGGDLVSYVAYVLRLSQGDAFKTLAHYLGVSDEPLGEFERTSTATPTPARPPKEPTFKPIYPPPPEAAKSCPFNFPQFGKASHYWDYKSAHGGLLMRVCRFDRTTSAGERAKEYRPVVYGTGTSKGKERTGWHWRQLPDNRPLYGLDYLAAAPVSAPVVLVEGEKACDAARGLFNSYPCITWSGGSKAIGKTDFSPLAGRDVWLWPDNDLAGDKTIDALRPVLNAIGVKSFRVFDLSVFARFVPGTGGQLVEGEYIWPEKADAFDAVAQGWLSPHLNELVQRNALLLPLEGEPPAPQPIITPIDENTTSDKTSAIPYSFKVDNNGVYAYDPKAEKHRRICSRLDVLAYCRDANDAGDNWGILVRFNNRDGKEKRLNFPLELFGSDGGTEVTKRLLGMGLEYDAHRESKRKVLEYLQGHKTQERIGLVHKTGWHKSAFVLPDRIIGATDEQLLFYSEGASLCKLSERGTLAEWQENVSRYCIDNPLALFAVSAAFSAPLVDLLGVETMGFHLYGDSSCGKSTLLDMACSVFGKPADYKKAWRSTDNGMESLAASHSEMLLALDEINQFDPRKLGDAVYMLGNGSGKTRANDRGGARDDMHRWRFTFLSNGEKTLEQYMGEAGKTQTAGMEMRFLEIYATPHDNEFKKKLFGVFNNLHGKDKGADLSELIKGNMAKYHGTAFPAFLNALVRELEGNRNKFIADILLRLENFREKRLSKSASGQVHRAAVKFALVGWAGEMATHWGVTGWQQGQAITAAATCFSAWLHARGGDGNFEEKQMLEHVRQQFTKYSESRFKRWDDPEESKNAVIDSHVAITAECWGFRRESRTKDYLEGDSSDVIFYVFKDAFKTDICKGFDHNRIAKILRTMGALQPTIEGNGKERMDRKEKLPRMGNKRVWCYKITLSALMAEGEESENDLQNVAGF